MTLGLFDLPAPLLQWTNDAMIGFVPIPLAIAVWAGVAGVICMELYRILSPQKRIGRVKQEANSARLQLAQHEGELEDALPLMKVMLVSSLKRVGIVLPATVLAAYPVLALLVWLSTAYGHRYPLPDEEMRLAVASPYQARWIAGNHSAPRIQVSRPPGVAVLDVALPVPVPVLHKRAWWNALVANPAGYLPDDAPVDKIEISLPHRELFSVGPGWLRGWEAVFLPVLLVVSLVYKSARHID